MRNNRLDYEVLFRKITSVAIAVMLLSSVGVINFPINDSFGEKPSQTGKGSHGKPTDTSSTSTSSTEPAAETATEPAAETATEPAAETATEPAAETATEPPAIIETDLSTDELFQKEVTIVPVTIDESPVVISAAIPEDLVGQGVEFQLFEVDGTTTSEVTYDETFAVEYV
ncbi:MAG TPA: hypothetical protein VJZ17_00495, partial [Nitrosopumilaceae archaeon]|nr:hypothetical protein [Nitrosopumilaceae archaeon]